jgi:hypothetical protein
VLPYESDIPEQEVSGAERQMGARGDRVVGSQNPRGHVGHPAHSPQTSRATSMVRGKLLPLVRLGEKVAVDGRGEAALARVRSGATYPPPPAAPRSVRFEAAN